MRRVSLRLARMACALLLLMALAACDMVEPCADDGFYVCFTFDDTWAPTYATAAPILQQYGYPGVNAINSGYVGRSDKMTWDQLRELELEHGWETAGHTVHHVNLPEVSLEEAEWEIVRDKRNMLSHGLDPVTFVLPFGHASEPVMQIILQNYQNVRNSLNLQHYAPIDRTNIGYFYYATEYTADDAIQRVALARQRGESLVVLGFHVVSDDDFPNAPDQCSVADFTRIVEYIHDHGYQVVTLREAVKEIGDERWVGLDYVEWRFPHECFPNRKKYNALK